MVNDPQIHVPSIFHSNLHRRVPRGGEPAACHGGRGEAQRPGGDPQGAVGTATATATATPRCRKTMAGFHDLMGFYGDLMEFNGILWWLNGIEPKKTKIYGDSMDI